MLEYAYKAMDSSGHVVRGRISANNTSDLELRLGRTGNDLISFREVRAGGSLAALLRRRHPVKRQDIITMCFHQEQFIRSGIPLLEGLVDLRDSLDHPRLRPIISAMIESIQGGKTMSQAMADFPDVYDEVMVRLVHAGEQSGQLEVILNQIVDNLKWLDEMVSQTKKAMLLPIISGVVIIAVVGALMTLVVPQLVGFLKTTGQELPIYTRALIFTSEVLANFWYLVLGIPVLIFIGVRQFAQRNAAFALRLDAMKLRIYVIGPVLEKIILNRLVTNFAIMFRSGITVPECLRICQEIAGNRAISRSLLGVSQRINEGQSVSTSFEKAKLFPPLVVRMIRVGEATGGLDDALMNVSYFYDREIKEAVARMQALVGPLMTLVLGAVLGWVMVSVLSPIYDVLGKIKP